MLPMHVIGFLILQVSAITVVLLEIMISLEIHAARRLQTSERFRKQHPIGCSVSGNMCVNMRQISYLVNNILLEYIMKYLNINLQLKVTLY